MKRLSWRWTWSAFWLAMLVALRTATTPAPGLDDQAPVLTNGWPNLAQPCGCCQRPGGATARDGRDGFLLANLHKIDPEKAVRRSCEAPSAADGVHDRLPSLALNFSLREADNETVEKRVAVTALVSQALDDQVRMLQAKAGELQRWGPNERAAFRKWFGTTDEEARAMIRKRLGILLKVNELYSVRNFRRASPSRPGVFAFVRPADPSKVFLDLAFVKAPRLGENSRAGTITHEMSHFLIAGGTQDHVYGTAGCKELARKNPRLALNNADNSEFYVENAR
jgi:hypothetical protein